MIRLLYLHENDCFEIKYKHVIFPGGEHHVQLDQLYDSVIIDARVANADDFMHVLTLTDALRRSDVETISLVIPYFPGARQDRHEPGFAFTAKLYADLINQQKYAKVIILDPHSSVVPALIDNCITVPPVGFVKSYFDQELADKNINGIVAPDLGASKRAQQVADSLKLPLFQGMKHRDPITGQLSNFSLVDAPGLKNSLLNLLVVDDICDGGGTFNMIGEWFNKNVPHARLWLWVTHGIFSKGFDELSKYYEGIGSTDSFPNKESTGLYYVKIHMGIA